MTDVGDENATVRTLEREALTAVGLLLIRLVLAVSHAIARQGVVDTVAIATLELIDDVAGGVECCARKAKECI